MALKALVPVSQKKRKVTSRPLNKGFFYKFYLFVTNTITLLFIFFFCIIVLLFLASLFFTRNDLLSVYDILFASTFIDFLYFCSRYEGLLPRNSQVVTAPLTLFEFFASFDPEKYSTFLVSPLGLVTNTFSSFFTLISGLASGLVNLFSAFVDSAWVRPKYWLFQYVLRADMEREVYAHLELLKVQKINPLIHLLQDYWGSNTETYLFDFFLYIYCSIHSIFTVLLSLKFLYLFFFSSFISPQVLFIFYEIVTTLYVVLFNLCIVLGVTVYDFFLTFQLATNEWVNSVIAGSFSPLLKLYGQIETTFHPSSTAYLYFEIFLLSPLLLFLFFILPFFLIVVFYQTIALAVLILASLSTSKFQNYQLLFLVKGKRIAVEIVKSFVNSSSKIISLINNLPSYFAKPNQTAVFFTSILWYILNRNKNLHKKYKVPPAKGPEVVYQGLLSLRFSSSNIFFSFIFIPSFIFLIILLQKPFIFLKTFWDGLSFYLLTCLPNLSFLRDITNFDNAVEIFFVAYIGDFPDGLDLFFNYNPDEIQFYSAHLAYGAQFTYWNYPLWLMDSYKLALFGLLVLLLFTLSLHFLQINQKWFSLALATAIIVLLADLYTEYFLHSSLSVERLFIEAFEKSFQNFINGLTPMEPVSTVYYTMEEDLIEDLFDVRPWFQDNICDVYDEYQRKKKFIRYMRPVWFFLLQRAGTYYDD